MVKFSIYGNTPETYEVIHRGLKFSLVEKNIRDFIELRNKLKKKTLVKIKFLPQDINRHERDDFMKKWAFIIDKHGGDSVEEFFIHNWIYGKNYRHVDSDVMKKKKSCGIPFVSLQLLWDGNVTACCYDYEGRMKFGNLKSNSIEKIWNSLEFRIFRKLHQNSLFKSLEVCTMCDQLR